ncbi:unnamed protein product [marine sediment metagenome]|uniref:Uncharacterized protein n=1 Tax=marine sediment metagenome TaxID=412755 RepID=X0VNZ3_9ZZZZ
MERIQHPIEVHGLNTILEDGIKVEDLEVKDLLFLILIELRIANQHNNIITEEEIDNDDT